MCVHVPRDARKCRKQRRNEAIARAINFNWEQHVDSLHNLLPRGEEILGFFLPSPFLLLYSRIFPLFLYPSLFSALAHKRSSSLFSLLCACESLPLIRYGEEQFFFFCLEKIMCNNCRVYFLFNIFNRFVNLINIHASEQSFVHINNNFTGSLYLSSNKNLYPFESCIRYLKFFSLAHRTFARGNENSNGSIVSLVAGQLSMRFTWSKMDDGHKLFGPLGWLWHVDTITLCLLECYSMPRNPTGA